ncbi:hypothetical protein ACYCAX_25790 [Pseudomonas sp. MT3]
MNAADAWTIARATCLARLLPSFLFLMLCGCIPPPQCTSACNGSGTWRKSMPVTRWISWNAPRPAPRLCISMNAKRTALLLLAIALLGVLLFTRLASNALMLLMDRNNFIPAEASILTLAPYVINEGSSSYWLYAEDGSNYYHFTYEPGREYLVMSKSQHCPAFEKEDVRTWCHAQIHSAP